MANVSMTPRFILAKYVPDLARMEPRNVGLFLWWRGDVRMQFLKPSEIDFVNDKETYQRWIDFWSKRIASDHIAPARGKPISKSDPACMDALLSTQKGQYALVDGGELLSRVRKRELGSVLEYLFSDLVAVSGHRQSIKEASRSLAQVCESAIRSAGIIDRPDFARKYPVECGVFGGQRRFRFTYGIGDNGKPRAVFQRVLLNSEQSINSAGLMIHEVTDDAIVPSQHCSALVRKRDITNESAEEGYDWLIKICAVIDVDEADARDRILACIPNGQPRAH